MKSFFRNIHLYLSLFAGLIITCSCFTGTVLVFEKEITRALHPQWYQVIPAGHSLPLQQLAGSVIKQYPDAPVTAITVYNDASRTVEVGISLSPAKTGNMGNEKPHQRKENVAATIFVNPYTGKIQGEYIRKQSFLYAIEKLHRYLLAGKNSIGSTLVSISTLIFLFVLITGLILWWPETKNIMRQRIKIKWGASKKRLIHDLHIVTGFYTSFFMIIIVLTGLIMTFKWANKALFAIAGSKLNDMENIYPQSESGTGVKGITFDASLQNVKNEVKNSAFFVVSPPGNSEGVYTLSILKKGAVETTSDIYYIDQYTGKVAGRYIFANKSLSRRIRAFIKPIHTGAICGASTKVISFIVCLLSLIFPVTGLLMWLNRIKKKKPVKKAL